MCGADIDPVVYNALQAASADTDPSSALAVVADVEHRIGAVKAWSSSCGRPLGGLDALINNAGIGGPSTAAHETDPAEFIRVIGVNLIGPFHMMRAAVPLILEGGRGGAVVNVGSILGQVAEAGSGAYAASKAGLAQLGQAMALELGPQGIRVNTVAPGYMLTSMHEEYMLELATTSGRPYEETVESLRSSVPLRRHGTPKDVGQVVAWLLRTRLLRHRTDHPCQRRDPAHMTTTTGRRLLVTGAGSGIGNAVCEAATSQGWHVVGIDRDALALDRVAGATGSATIVGDVTNEDAVELAVDHATELLGGLPDALVTAAGVYDVQASLDVSLADFLRVLTINTAGSFLFARTLVSRS